MTRKPPTRFSSFIAGALGAVVVVALVAMTPPVQEALAFIRVFGTVQVPGIPQAKDMVRINGGETYMVPTEKFLRIRAVVNQSANARTVTLSFDSVEQNDFVLLPFGYVEFDIGYVAGGGTQVAVSVELNKLGFVVGILEDA